MILNRVTDFVDNRLHQIRECSRWADGDGAKMQLQISDVITMMLLTSILNIYYELWRHDQNERELEDFSLQRH